MLTEACVAIFADTTNPTPFGLYDDDTVFATDADKMVVFVKRKLGDDVLSVELTKKQIWGNFEETLFEYSSIINQYQAKSQLVDFLGFATGSIMSGSEEKFPRANLEYLTRFAEPYAMEAGIGGSYNTLTGSIEMKNLQQDYDIYSELKDGSGNVIFDQQATGKKSKLKIVEVFHYNPNSAYRFFDTTSAINYLNNEFSFESFTPETMFYVLPVFEDILRAGQLDLSNRVRRSNYSYEVVGTNIRVYPMPTGVPVTPKKLWLRVRYFADPLDPAYQDDSIQGVSNLGNIPFGNLIYTRINSIGMQWIRQYCLALSKEQLGLIRSKFQSIPVPGSDLSLNGTDLVSQGREDQNGLKDKLKEMLESLTYEKLIEIQSARSEQINKQLSYIPVPNGGAIFMG